MRFVCTAHLLDAYAHLHAALPAATTLRCCASPLLYLLPRRAAHRTARTCPLFAISSAAARINRRITRNMRRVLLIGG
jgi:hypothetical protein